MLLVPAVVACQGELGGAAAEGDGGSDSTGAAPGGGQGGLTSGAGAGTGGSVGSGAGGGSSSGSAGSGGGSATTTTSAASGGATTSSATTSAASGGGTSEGVAQLCVDTINQHRASIGLPPLQRWVDAESCSDGEAESDGNSGMAHGAFGSCGESAQNECPGWPGPPDEMIGGCLQMMWNEGPGEDFSQHGHYINMSSTRYTRVACGFHTFPDGRVWAVQNFQ